MMVVLVMGRQHLYVLDLASNVRAKRDLELKLREYSEHLEVSLEEANRSRELLEQFVANVSHEMRSPLTVFLGVVKMLRGPRFQVTAQVDELLASARRPRSGWS